MEEENPLTLPLRPQVVAAAKKDTLPIRIAQINAQRGSFRNITEQSLQAEIDARKARGDASDEDVEETKPTGLDATERQDLLYKRRADITQFAVQAHRETTTALDFVSLLLSKHAPRQAEMSISPHCKQLVPLGSLNVDVIRTPQKSESAEKDTAAIARGWKLEGYNAAANKLLKAAARLESEVAAETKYWDEVLAVKEKGWKVCRLPRERQALGVQYGFLEATPTFRDRGLASLRRADDGSLVLDRGLVPIRPRAVRVQVKKGDKVTGTSKLLEFVPTADDSVEKRILQARDTLFEEELFHELTREARILASSGVTTHHNLIQCEYDEGQEILLDLVDLDDAPDETEAADRTREQDTVAEAIAYSLRILLSYAHRQNYQRRTQFPPPLTTQRRSTPQYQLLRPIISYLQHDSHVRSLQSFLADLFQVLRSAGLPSTYTGATFSSLKLSRKSSDPPTVESLVTRFLEPLQSKFSGTMANPTSTFTIKVLTNMPDSVQTRPVLGTEYGISIRLPSYPYVQPPSSFGLRSGAASLLVRMITLDLTTFITSVSAKHATDAATTAPAEKPPLVWDAPFAPYGELVATVPGSDRTKKISLRLSRNELSLRTSWLRRKDGSDSDMDEEEDGNPDDQPQAVGKLFYTWKGDGGGGGQKTLEGVIVELSRNEESEKSEFMT